MLKTYRSRCAVCALPIVEALDAAHIKRWSACNHKERLDPANGILLCRNDHALFDAGLFAVAADGRLRLNRARLKSDAIDELDGTVLSRPASPDHGPGIEYLRWHREHTAGLDE
ncbi:MAG: HNH endonuclease [Gemmatimonadetes bacterium]|nr:HNH endonuclease [Gemmatimonadota bacterium]MXX72097.1 HNH endonuclease [Gemmatimonadota bacterium]MYC91065.1 HNH endonuclease [Gemmatimonadota bacterium]MYG36369.1 HNH endonuclease [Gemmatimonadota bacterium]MYJ16454.1 HNH endonuclease [Gemmatimonadota bacterium]